MDQVKVGLLGFGTVGTGVWKMIRQNQDLILQETGKTFEVVSILVKDLEKDRGCVDAQSLLTDDYSTILAKDVDVVVEAMGGIEPAKQYIEQALRQGRHVVSANKELIAKHGLELEQLAQEQGVHFLFEASVAGGIPVLGTVRHLLKANRIWKVSGILNGTSNYILTEMAQHGRDFAEVLQEAQAKGYAEQDPTSDVEGYDAVYKLAILSHLAMGAQVKVEDIVRKGITDITPTELQLAAGFGYSIKLLAQAEQYGEQGPVSCSVQPTLVPMDHSLASVQGVYNAVYLEGSHVQDITLVGQGAGEKPTGSAMVEDLTNIGRHVPVRGRSVYHPPVINKEEGSGNRFFCLALSEVLSQAEEKAWLQRCEQQGIEVQVHGQVDKRLACLLTSYQDGQDQQLVEALDGKVRSLVCRPILGMVEGRSQSKLPVAVGGAEGVS